MPQIFLFANRRGIKFAKSLQIRHQKPCTNHPEGDIIFKNIVSTGGKMPLSKETIGKRISNERKSIGLTQAELSEKIGISEKYLSRIECGKQLPSVVIIAKICAVLCISTDKLLSLDQSTISNNSLHNEISEFSIEEQKQILEIIKIIKKIKDQP